MSTRTRVLVLGTAALAALALTAPASAQEEDPCTTPPPGAILGTDNDVLVGTSGPDVIVARGGNDVILGIRRRRSDLRRAR